MSRSVTLDSLRSAYIIEAANSPKLLREVQKLRHQVFVVERGIFSAAANESKLESDEFDTGSHHLLIRRREDGQAIGAARLVPFRPDRAISLPMQRVCSASHFGTVPTAALGEISRFALSKHRRGSENPNINALLLLTLIEAVLQLSLELGLTHWCAVMERSLMRLLRGIGIHFQPVGPLVNYHGQRQPAVAKIAAILSEGQQQSPSYYNFVTRSRPAARHVAQTHA